MTHPIASSNFFADLFTPLPSSATEQKKANKDILDHVADYTETTSGAWDVFRVGNHVFSAIELIMSPLNKFAGVVNKTKDIFNSAGFGLSIPQLFSDSNSLRHSATDLMKAHNLPSSDPLKNKKITLAAKKSFLDTMNLTGTVAQISLFLDHAKIFIFDAMPLKILDGVLNLTGVITDGAEFIGECFKLKHYASPEAQPRSTAESTKLQQKKALALLVIAKNVASIALGVISIGVIILGIATTTFSAFSVTILGISAFWLTMKLASYFYNKVIVESPMDSFSKTV